MLLTDLMDLLKVYSECHLCGSDKVGDGKGELLIQDNIFIRSCACGWHVRLDRNNALTPEQKLKLNLNKHINSNDMWYRGYVAGMVKALECHDIEYEWLDYDYREEK